MAATRPKIFVGLPKSQPLNNGKAPPKLIKLLEAFSKLVPEYEVQLIMLASERESHAVNMLIEQFRNDPSGEWFLWLNDRVEITPEQLFLLIDAKKGVCGALGTTCKNPSEWLASFYPDVQAADDGLLSVPELGALAKVYHRSVFDVIEKAQPTLAYIYDSSGHSLAGFCQERLETFLDYKRLLPPPYYLDFLCRKEKIGIFAHTKVVVKTKGSDGILYPRKEPYRSWEFKKLLPPVCAEDLPHVAKETNPDLRSIKICVQYCDKDKEAAERLCERILEQTQVKAWMVYSPGNEYPKGPNTTALHLLRYNWPDYKAILLLEPDCCPLTPDWLIQLYDDWQDCAAAGKLLMGSWHPLNADHPTMGHLNGNLMFSPRINDHIEIPDVPDDKPWDTYLAATFQPNWARTGLIKNLNRHKTATTKQLMSPECGSKIPVLSHGVKDDSAWEYAKTLCAIRSLSPATEKISSG